MAIKVAVVGSGMAGIAAARWLTRQHTVQWQSAQPLAFEVTLFDKVRVESVG
jgi:2-polyprenyl-6-methoxyphenol hydroxylase-like FAD-dependent oxidoreductase